MYNERWTRNNSKWQTCITIKKAVRIITPSTHDMPMMII